MQHHIMYNIFSIVIKIIIDRLQYRKETHANFANRTDALRSILSFMAAH